MVIYLLNGSYVIEIVQSLKNPKSIKHKYKLGEEKEILISRMEDNVLLAESHYFKQEILCKFS